jgi:hypothetical protein
MMTIAGIALLVASAALLLAWWREPPTLARSLTIALAMAAFVVLTRRHGTAPGVCVALAAATAAIASLVVARPLAPRAVARVPAVAALLAAVALVLEAFHVA